MRPPVRFDIFTIFPEYLAPLSLSVVGRAQRAGLLEVVSHDLRQWGEGRHRSVDDAPYGGGPGMVMRADVWGRALDTVVGQPDTDQVLVIPTPSGRKFDQSLARELSRTAQVVVACGRYEGIDARVAEHYRQHLPVLELSVGDVVLAGGEAAALVIVEAVARMIPGVLGNAQSAGDDSFGDRPGLAALEGPVYTRPESWRGLSVPEVLGSGDHAAVARWRAEQSRERTALMRPDLVDPPSASP